MAKGREAARAAGRELWESARLKAVQLEEEIKRSSATPTERANMLHSLSKLTMFAHDSVEASASEKRMARTIAGWLETAEAERALLGRTAPRGLKELAEAVRVKFGGR